MIKLFPAADENSRQEKFKLAAILAVLYLALTLLFASLGFLKNLDRRIQPWDSVFYYSYLTSAYFDHDLDFSNDFGRFASDGVFEFAKAPNGATINLVPVGSAILWTPLFLSAHGATLAANASGATLAVDGLSAIYQRWIYVGDSLYGFIGLIFTAFFLRKYVGVAGALVGCAAILWASPLTHYVWPLTLSSHNASFLTASLFLYAWSRYGLAKRTAVSAGLMVLVRYQEGLFLVPVLMLFFFDWFRSRCEPGAAEKNLRKLIEFALVFAAIVSIQPWIWKMIYGSFLNVPFADNRIHWDALQLGGVLFSWRHGLLSWHPALLLGLAGLLFFYRQNRRAGFVFGMMLVLAWIFNAGMTDWWASWSFGHRRFISCLPLFALGVGFLYEKAVKPFSKSLALSLVAVLSLWNLLFVYQYNRGLIPRGEAPSLKEVFIDKFHLPTVEKTRQLINTAYLALAANQLEYFERYTRQAYAMDPDSRLAQTLAGYMALRVGDQKLGLEVFTNWHKRDPKDFLVRWSLTEFLIRDRNYVAAAALFEKPEIISADEPFRESIRQAIGRKAQTTLTQRFVQLFSERLKSFLSV